MSPVGISPELDHWRNCVEGRKFVWLHCPPWDGVWTRQNHFARRLAALGAEVLYVESPRGWGSQLRREGLRALRSSSLPDVREVEPGLHVMASRPTAPGSMLSDAVARWNARQAARGVQRWLQSRDWSEWVAWCRVPKSVFYLDALDPAAVVYDVTDDYELYARSERERRLVEQRERALAKRADVVFVTAEGLLEKPTLREQRPVLIPNGVDTALFEAAADPTGSVAPAIAAVSSPVIGYVGLTSHWMDFDLLRQLGDQWPDHIVMVGPIQPEVEAEARSIPGVRWVGFVPHTELASVLRGFDVCILPHVVNELRRKANPLKIWEYLATGKPFVSVDLPALAPIRSHVRVASSPEDFVSLVSDALSEAEDQDSAVARQKAARTYSWDRLTKDAIECMSNNHLI